MITSGSLSFHCRILKPDDNASSLGNRRHHQPVNRLVDLLHVSQPSLDDHALDTTGYRDEDPEKDLPRIQ